MVSSIEKLVTITDVDTDTDILSIPSNKIGRLVQVEISNPDTTNTARVRLWDSYTDVNGSTKKVQKFDWYVEPNKSVVIKEGFEKKFFGKIVAQSTIANVVIGVRVELE